MAETRRRARRTGGISYHPDRDPTAHAQHPHRHHLRRLGRITVYQVEPDKPPRAPLGTVNSHPLLADKLAGSRDSALRFLRSVIHSHPPKVDPVAAAPTDAAAAPIPTPVAPSLPRGASDDSMPSALAAAAALRYGSLTPSNSSTASPRPSLADLHEHDSAASSSTSRSRADSAATLAAPDEKPLVAANGVAIFIRLAEPVLFLQGHDHNDTTAGNTAMLRGTLVVRVSKSAKLKAINLRFRGLATTKWPEGIPPKKTEYEEVDRIMSHTWTFFNAMFPAADGGSGADRVRLTQGIGATAAPSPYLDSTPALSMHTLNPRDLKRLSLQTTTSRSFEKDKMAVSSTVASKGYRTFHPGEYAYNFELPIDSRLPETIDVDLGSVRYDLEASIERAGAFRANLLGTQEVTLIRAPSENSLEQIEPIAISRTWEDQLHYDIVISGKSFPFGAKVPIAFKLTPLAKVQCHRIKVFMTENIEYFCSNKRVHRIEPTRKFQLFEKRPDGHSTSAYPGSTIRVTSGGGVPYDQRVAAAAGEEVPLSNTSNLLGQLESETTVGPTEMEFNVQLPGCHDLAELDKLHRMHFDTTYQNIQVHHWIKIVMRLSKPDPDDSNKRRHFEISIDSPFHILSCRANQANIELPAYQGRASDDPQSLSDCGCPGAPPTATRRSSATTLHHNTSNSRPHLPPLNTTGTSTPTPSFANYSLNNSNNPPLAPFSPGLARPQQAHVHGQQQQRLQRPMHMLRAPSFNPPAFEDEEPPPPLVTPPPQYNDIASPSHGLADYFSRLADAYDDEEPSSSDDERGSVRGRVNVPLTPGSRVNRSMELQRNWVPVSH